MERRDDTNEQLFGLRSRCLCRLSAFFLPLTSIQPLWKRAFCLLCLVDDSVGELMRAMLKAESSR